MNQTSAPLQSRLLSGAFLITKLLESVLKKCISAPSYSFLAVCILFLDTYSTDLQPKADH